MAAPVIALVRHGAYRQLPGAPSAHQPFGLTDEGRAQLRLGARELLETAAAHGWSLVPLIDSSRLLRAWQSAKILADHCDGSTVESFDALAERGLGCAANLTVAQIEEVLREDPRYPAPPANWKADSRYRLPLQGAESLLEAGQRVARHIERRTAEPSGAGRGGGVKIFVGHGAAFRHAAFHLGALAFERLAGLSMHHGRPLFLERGDGGQWRHVAGEWKQRPASAEAKD